MGDESAKPMSVATGAVFLSYASQDAEAARRIYDALRAAGVEVWLDQSELRGGDAWDRQIREQIHDCRLFIALISAHTEARDEGYFRREWKLAVDSVIPAWIHSRLTRCSIRCAKSRASRRSSGN